MAGISEVIQTIGAVVIFSLILLTTNRVILQNTFKEVETQAEVLAVSLAQDIIEEAQTKPFDANTTNGNIPKKTPEGFSSCGPGSEGDRNDFDDYSYEESTGWGHSEMVDTQLGEDSFHVEVEVSYVSPPDFNMKDGSKTVPTNFKKMVVTVSSEYLQNKEKKIELSHLRRYYKTKN